MDILMQLCSFNAAYADAIDSDCLERWPLFFTEQCHYRVTHIENEREGLAAGLIYADSQAMLIDRISALREANIYEKQSYRHILGIPLITQFDGETIESKTPFIVVRIMATGQTELFATGVYKDQLLKTNEQLLLTERVVVCDSTVTDTLLALPL
jgi:3-phenylpropionate/cinnamic acid dioxygenase small subunit